MIEYKFGRGLAPLQLGETGKVTGMAINAVAGMERVHVEFGPLRKLNMLAASQIATPAQAKACSRLGWPIGMQCASAVTETNWPVLLISLIIPAILRLSC